VSLWTNRFSSPGTRRDDPSGLVVDSVNNVFVTGYATYSASDSDYVTIKYSSTGTPLWTNQYNGPAGGFDNAVAITVDGSNAVIVTGTSFGTGGTREWATVKYSNSGGTEWARRYGDPGSSDAWAVSVAADGTNVYVGGYNAAGEFATVAYLLLDGTPIWTNNYGPGYGFSFAIAVKADDSGHVFVTGFAPKGLQFGTIPFDFDYVTLAYSSTGIPLWTNLYEGPGLNSDNNDRTVGMAIGAGNVFVLGRSQDADSYEDFATVAYSPTGATVWTNRFSGDWGHDSPQAIAADSAGNVFVTGLRGDAALNTSYYVTLGYSGGGAQLWKHEIVYDAISPGAITANASGFVFVTGNGTGGGVTLKYASSLPAPGLGFQWLNNQLIISWSGSCALQSSPNVTGPYLDILGATSPYTNSPGGPQQFFRLSCN